MVLGEFFVIVVIVFDLSTHLTNMIVLAFQGLLLVSLSPTCLLLKTIRTTLIILKGEGR